MVNLLQADGFKAHDSTGINRYSGSIASAHYVNLKFVLDAGPFEKITSIFNLLSNHSSQPAPSPQSFQFLVSNNGFLHRQFDNGPRNWIYTLL
jgi:hypothetical protein